MSIIDHPLWDDIKSYVVVQEYRREGGTRNPRVRLEVKPMPPALQARALRIKVECVYCGDKMHPIRARKGKALRGEDVAKHLYYACACPLDVNVACSRSAAARNEYINVKMAL